MRGKYYFFSLFAAASFVALWGCSLKFKNSDSLPGSTHVVKKGDTLWEIANRHHIPIDELLEVNGISDPSSLRLGQLLFIPDSDADWGKSSVTPTLQKAPISEDDGKTITLDWPVKNGVTFRTFDKNPARLFEGIALGAPLNTPIHAAAAGEVIHVGDDGTRFGRIVIIRHEDPFVTVYAHLDRVDVKKGEVVKKGTVIGTVGTSGGVESPRVYFQVRKNRTPIDPERYLVKQG